MGIINKTNIRVKKLARISSWLLLLNVIALVLSGWGITQTGVIYNLSFGLIDRRAANTIHNTTVLPLALFFLLHVFLNISLSVTAKSRNIKWIVNGALLVIGAGLLGIVIYMQYFRLGG